MDQKEFVLNSRYRVRPASNTVIDLAQRTEVRLEPRLVKLLCILHGEAGRLVSREQLVKEIWEDYGGGEEGLTHAVSSLRKVLGDTNKKVIETIPKKGYILHSAIGTAAPIPEAELPPSTIRQKRLLYGAFILLLAVGAFFYFSGNDQKNTAALPPKTDELSVPFNEVSKPSNENFRNIIITVGPDSTQYKLKFRGEGRPEFYINGRLLSPDEMEGHSNLIRSMTDQLQQRNAK